MIAAAAAAGSAAMNNQAAKKVDAGVTAATMAERARQEDMRTKAETSFQNLLSTQGKDAQLKDQADQTQKLENSYTQNINPQKFTELLPGQGDASDTVKTDIVNAGNTGYNRSVASGKARAALEGYSRTGLNNDIQFQNENQNLNDIASQSRGSANVLPLEVKAAQGAGQSQRGWANLLSTVSNIAGSVAAGSAFAGAGGAGEAAGAGAGAGAGGGATGFDILGKTAPMASKFRTLLGGGSLYGNIPGTVGTSVEAYPL